MDYPQLEKEISTRFGWVITLTLVAGSAFLIGSNYRPVSSQTRSEAVEAAVVTATSSPVIEQIQQTLAVDQSAETAEVVTDSIGLVNINTASESELDVLAGIGPSKAKAIVDYRTKNGPFVRIEDILNVKGIGPKTLDGFRAQITL